MLKTALTSFLPILLILGFGGTSRVGRTTSKDAEGETGTLEKMIVANGKAALEIDLNRLQGSASRSRMSSLRFALAPNSFFTILVFNDELRGPLPGSIELVSQNAASLPAPLRGSSGKLVLETTAWGEDFELIVRDGKTGFVFFNIEGHQYDYRAKERLLQIKDGRLLVSSEFAAALGRPSEAGSIAGTISLSATMRAIEISKVVNGEVTSSMMPALNGASGIQPRTGTNPGPDVIVGDLSGLNQPSASSGTQVGLAVGTDSCNAGTVNLNWFALPANDHPVIPQNLYRMSGGAANNDRFEQIGQSSVKHAFTALTQNLCGFGCNGTGGSQLGSGCSDPYSASLNSGGTGHTLGSRAWINPFTGAYPRGDSATPPNTHTGHIHDGPAHRILVEINDLSTTLNPGATYYAEAQYVTPHEYAWCLANPTQCNMYNNVSYRQYTVSGTTSPFSFSTSLSTVREKPAIAAWTGSTSVDIQPAPGTDGVGTVAYKVTNPSPGVWHYEYAVYNQNLDRAINLFSVPVPVGVNVSNVGFHAPPQHPGFTSDGTVGNAGYSSTPWSQALGGGTLDWNTETFAQNPNANAIRWGTLYNFRFDCDRPPQNTVATVGFFKTGSPITVAIQGPSAPVGGPNIYGRDGSGAEPAAGTSPLLFTVALSAPAGAGGLSVNYATAADAGGANPATGGVSCGGTADYLTANGTLNFASGQQLKTVAISVCSDTASPETAETFLLNLSGATNGAIADAQAVGTIAQGGGSTPGGLLITEMRTSGPGGLGDDFVELYNNSATPLTVAASDASAGYGVFKLGVDCNATPVLVGTIPNGTIIPARGHYLLVGSQYSLAGYATGDLTLSSDIESDRNVGVFSTADIINISSSTRLDAVGFGGSTGGGICDLPREGTTLQPGAGSASEFTFVRKETTGLPQDTNDNAADFVIVSTTPGVAVGSNATPTLGAPGPENLASPALRPTIKASLVDTGVSSSASPNRERDTTPDPANNSTLGTLDIRRKFKNNTGAPVTRLRFRIIDITTTPVPAGTADLRARTSGVVVVSLTGGGTANVEGTTLETPPTQLNGGGTNSTMAAGTVTSGAPIAPGASINLRFLLGVQQGGTFRFFITVEALP